MTTAKDEEIFKLRGALSLARLHFEQGLYDRAEPVYRRALLFFDQGEELRQCLQCLSVLYSVKNHYSDALEMYVRLLSLNEAEYGKSDRRTVAVMREMASIYIQMGQPQKAEKIHQRATMRERDRERPTPIMAEVEDNFEGSSAGLPQFEQAEETQQRVEKVRRELRPLISGFIVDFTSNRTLMLAKLIIAGIVLVSILLVAMILPRNPQPIDVYRSIPHDYQTADDKAHLTLVTDSQCSFANEEEPPAVANFPYTQYLSDWRDVLGVIYGSIYEKQYWVYRVDDAVRDEDDRIYYGAHTAEAKVIEEMAVVKKAIESFFIVHQRYPKRISEKIVLPYINPISNLQELPSSQILTLGDRKWTTATSLKERAKFYNSLSNGNSWPDEPPLKPGSINTCSVVMISEAGEFYDFILQGGDRHGKPILTSIPGKAYIVSLQGAKDLDTPIPPVPFATKLLVRPRHVWLIKPDLNSLELHLLNHGLSYFWAFLGLCFLAYWVRKRYFEDDSSRAGKFVVYAIACAVLCGIYELSRLCP